MSTRKCRRYKVEYLENIQGDTYPCCEFIHIQTAQKAEDAMVNEYVEKYRADEIEMETANISVYIKGPDFIDWWSIVEV